MTAEEVYKKYPPGYHKLHIKEWMAVGAALADDVLSPGGIVGEYGVSRSWQLYLAKSGKIHYFIVSRPWSERGYVLVPRRSVERFLKEQNPEHWEKVLGLRAENARKMEETKKRSI